MCDKYKFYYLVLRLLVIIAHNTNRILSYSNYTDRELRDIESEINSLQRDD